MACDRQLQSRKVCVLGAGMAGLAAALELRREGHAVTVLEQNADVGGQWLYEPTTDAADPLGKVTPVRVHSGIYTNLRLISPRECMGFSDFPFLPRPGRDRDPRRLPGHREVYLYLKDFCDEFKLMDVVRLNTRALRVAMEQGAADVPKWVVRSIDLRERDTEEEEEAFDAVVVATGHYSQPSLPSIKGMEEWGRRQLHSHSYRVPDPFRGEVVVMVGLGDSGKDIALDLCRFAKEVHLSAKSSEEAMTPAMSKMLANHANISLHSMIECLWEDGRVVFADGACVVADTVMYCTGYTYSFPFLDTGGVVTVDDNRVGPLFEHVFPPSLAPSLSFVGIPKKVFVPWFFQAQGQWVAQVLSGRRSLPPEEEMLRSVEELYRARDLAGVPKKYTHEFGGKELPKINEFVEKNCDMPPMEGWKTELALSTYRNMKEDMETFRDLDRDDDDNDDVRRGIQRWYSLSLSAEARDGAAAAVAMAGKVQLASN